MMYAGRLKVDDVSCTNYVSLLESRLEEDLLMW